MGPRCEDGACIISSFGLTYKSNEFNYKEHKPVFILSLYTSFDYTE